MNLEESRTLRRPANLSPVFVGLILGLFGLQIVGFLELPARITETQSTQLLVGTLENWGLVISLLALVVYWEGRPLSSMGLRMPTWRETGVGLAAGLGAVILGLLATGIAVVTLGIGQPETLSVIASLPFSVKLALVGTAVITEEILWRGYPIERIGELTGRLWIGAAVSVIVFVAVHYPAWGLVGAIPQTVFALILVGVYVWGRNVVTCMVTHGVINAIMIFVLPTFL
jgi:membrane protease YdiL (CAAX protease family)